ncbi:hypothetical protein C2G38_2176163 [Gigaspora rosea]|uniref:Uncharacterized protein n=1 Tax=Gigaspora rosea TaxID=44941 RepID=A0A397VGI5_9GLOM|nr:hypothetical protein C2G38_2176163 [Gigaspora rosea]
MDTDDKFYSALLLIFSSVFQNKNKPISISLPNIDKNKPDDNSNTQTTSTINILPLKPTTTKPDFNFSKRFKDLLQPEESTTNSTTTTTIPSTAIIDVAVAVVAGIVVGVVAGVVTGVASNTFFRRGRLGILLE